MAAAIPTTWEPAPAAKESWVSDGRRNACTHCGKKFMLMFGKHHCRYCLDVFCDKCAPVAPPPKDRACATCRQTVHSACGALAKAASQPDDEEAGTTLREAKTQLAWNTGTPAQTRLVSSAIQVLDSALRARCPGSPLPGSMRQLSTSQGELKPSFDDDDNGRSAAAEDASAATAPDPQPNAAAGAGAASGTNDTTVDVDLI